MTFNKDKGIGKKVLRHNSEEYTWKEQENKLNTNQDKDTHLKND